MLAKLRSRLTFANVVSVIALFVALGGSSYSALRINGRNIVNKSIPGKKLKNGTITGGKVKKNTLTGTQIDESKLGKVPLAAMADGATTAGSAGNADTLDGIDSTGFLRSTPPEPYHEVGTLGEPTFGSGWSNDSPATYSTAAFFKDAFGVVHLKGDVGKSGGDTIIFVLPAGYRPSKVACFSTTKGGTTTAAYNCIHPDGVVNQQSNDGDGEYFLDGVTFRAAG